MLTTTTGDESVKVTSFLDVVIQGYGWIGPIITILSIIVVGLIIEHFWTIRWAKMVNESETKATRELIEARKFKECVERVAGSRTMFGDVLTIGLRHGRHGFDAMQEGLGRDWPFESFPEYLGALEQRGTAINVGDHLIGLGYRLLNAAREEFGAEVTADIIERMADALRTIFPPGFAERIGAAAVDELADDLGAEAVVVEPVAERSPEHVRLGR